MKLHQYTDAEWRRLEQVLCPSTADMFVNIEAQLPLPAPVEPTANSPAPPLSPAEETSASTPVTVADALMWSAPRARRVRGVSA